jgi:tetratricopeptide (TPR) repeat protein
MLSWQQTEFLLKGVYLGFLVMIAWFVPQPYELAFIALGTIGGLVLFLGVAAFRKYREGFRPKGNYLGYLLFMLLENPGMVYAGLIVGLAVGTVFTFNRREVVPPAVAIPLEALWPVLGGGVLGAIFYNLRHVKVPVYRFWLSVAMLAILVGGAAAFYYYNPTAFSTDQLQWLAILLLLGIPGFYLLTFSGLVEESEIEIAAMCAALGIALWIFVRDYPIGAAVVLLPMGLFFVYTTRLLPYVRVMKHTLRGMSYRRMNQTQLALMSLGRALQLDPSNTLARHEMWDIHRDLDFASLQVHPELVPFLHFDFCLERINQLLQTKPDSRDLNEIHKMLDLIAKEHPALAPICAYWRAVARLHERNYDAAAVELLSILQLPQYYTAERQSIAFAAWQLAMYGHPEMTRRVGQVLLAQPGHHVDAIVAVEAQLAKTPDDPTAWDMKRKLYSELTEPEYYSIAQPDQPLPAINYDYVRELGLALLADPNQWQRGCAYLRIAAHGNPEQAPNVYIQIAQTHEKHGDRDGLWHNYQRAMQVGRAFGVDKLQPADKEALFTTVKKIGDMALQQNRIDAALEAYKFYSQYDNAGIETWRTLADLFEKKHDVWQALHCCEHALSYNAEDKDLLAKKDRYYYSIMPDDLKQRIENVRKWFDPQYCRDKATYVLEKAPNDFELLEWALHLTALALVAQPGSHAARFLKARIHRLRGEIAETTALLEEIRQHRPEKFANEEESKAWYFSHRLLGDLYLDSNPAQAVLCYEEFRKSDEAGADTSYKLGRAYEATGDFARAAGCYEEVTAYERHPLYYEARDGLDRVRRGAPTAR